MYTFEATLQPSVTSSCIDLQHVGGPKLHVQTWGNADPLLFFIHGFGEGCFVWNHIVPALRCHGSAITIDLRGHGDSARDTTCTYSTTAHVMDISESFQALCTRPVIIVGHSLGAEIAIHMAAMHRSRVLGVVLVDGGPQLNSEAAAYVRRKFSSQPWCYETIDEYVRYLQDKLPLASPLLLHWLAPQALRGNFDGGYQLKCDKALITSLEGSDKELLWSLFRSIVCPLLIIRGAASALLSRRIAIKMVQENSHCSLRTVPDAGHAVMLDNPSGFIAVLHEFISRTKRHTNR